MLAYNDTCTKQAVKNFSDISTIQKLAVGDTLHDFAQGTRIKKKDESYDTNLINLFKSTILQNALKSDFSFIKSDNYTKHENFRRLFFGSKFDDYKTTTYERQFSGFITNELNLQPCITSISSSEIKSSQRDVLLKKVKDSNGSIQIVLDESYNPNDRMLLANFIKTYLHGDMDSIDKPSAAPAEIRILFDADSGSIGDIFEKENSGGIRFYSMPCTGDSATTAKIEKLMLDPRKAIEYDTEPKTSFTSNYFTCGTYSAGYFPREGMKFGEDGTPYGCVFRVWKTANPDNFVEYYFGPNVTSGSSVPDIGKIFKRLEDGRKLDDIVTEMKNANHRTRVKLFTNQFVELFKRDRVEMEKFFIDYKRSGDFEQFFSVLKKIKDGNNGNYTFCSIDVMAVTAAKIYGIPSIWHHGNTIELYRNDRYQGTAEAREKMLIKTLSSRIDAIKAELDTSKEHFAKLKTQQPILLKLLDFLKKARANFADDSNNFKSQLYRYEFNAVIICLEKYLEKLKSIDLSEFVPTYWTKNPSTTLNEEALLNEEIDYLKTNNERILDINNFISTEAPMIDTIQNIPSSYTGVDIPQLGLKYINGESNNTDVKRILRLFTTFQKNQIALQNAKEAQSEAQRRPRPKVLEALESGFKTAGEELLNEISEYSETIYFIESEKEQLMAFVPFSIEKPVTPSQPTVAKLFAMGQPTQEADKATKNVKFKASDRGETAGPVTNRSRRRTNASVKNGSRRRTNASVKTAGPVKNSSRRRTKAIAQTVVPVTSRTRRLKPVAQSAAKNKTQRNTKFTENRLLTGGDTVDYYELQKLMLRVFNRCNLFMKSLVPLNKRSASYFDIMYQLNHMDTFESEQDAKGMPMNQSELNELIDTFFIDLVGFVMSELPIHKSLPQDVTFLLYILGILFDKENEVENQYIKAFSLDENAFKTSIYKGYFDSFMNPRTVYNKYIQMLNNYRFTLEDEFNCNLCIISVFALLEYAYYGDVVKTFIDTNVMFSGDTRRLIQVHNFDSPQIYVDTVLRQHLSAVLPALVTAYNERPPKKGSGEQFTALVPEPSRT